MEQIQKYELFTELKWTLLSFHPSTNNFEHLLYACYSVALWIFSDGQDRCFPALKALPVQQGLSGGQGHLAAELKCASVWTVEIVLESLTYLEDVFQVPRNDI